ncbi:type-F conjugative transfer system pilin assembly protein TrbC [Vibrio mimicus]|uniref:type-F conjugative transfer system pilin assembly protein TrbC n=1 Tax=Vibrio mimicus TaxID=674 RepID=UPI0011DC5DC5|nr:type-F conjugative transfer system pilin assembly protein TrbC [Vibrio mimicus]TXY44787.1 type-F conjugative transfer system pilin assembly protein TrbC [Vibrio mimicus]
MNQIIILTLSLFWLCHPCSVMAAIGYTQEELDALAELEQSPLLPADTPSLIEEKVSASQAFNPQIREQARAWQEKLNPNHLQGMVDIPEATPNPNAAPVGVMVFVSLTMPESSLRSLLRQSEHWQVPLIIRGVLPEGFPATAAKIQSLLQERESQMIESGFAINPEWFRTFNVTEVPTFVAVKPGRCLPGQPCNEADFDIVKGNVSLPDALEHLARGDNRDVVRRVLQRGTP